MKCQITDFERDFSNGGINVSLHIFDGNIEQIEALKGNDLSVEIKKWRERRSLDSNAYFHILVGKIAEALTISKAKAKNILVAKYGQPQLLEDGSILFYKTQAPVEYMDEQEFIHAKAVKFTEDAIFYKIYRGSHTYNTDEMAKLIEGTVADAKELGIDTATPTEIAHMQELWSKRYGKETV